MPRRVRWVVPHKDKSEGFRNLIPGIHKLVDEYKTRIKTFRYYKRHYEKFQDNAKFISFFENTMIPKSLASSLNTPISMEDLQVNKKVNLNKINKINNMPSRFLPKKIKIIKRMMNGFFLFLIVALSICSNFISIMNKKKQNVYVFKAFNFLNKQYFNYYFYKIKMFQHLIKAYHLDKQYNNTYINYYNLYLFSYLKYFEVILNFEDYKYEFDKTLRPDWNIDEDFPRFYKPSAKEKKPARMSTDFYDYMKRKNRIRVITKYSLRKKKRVNEPWNIVEKGPDNEEAIKKKRDLKNVKKLLVRHDNLYFFYIIYEFCLKIHDKLLASYFNYDFFGKVKIFKKKRKKIKLNADNEIKILNSPYLFLSNNEEDEYNEENNTVSNNLNFYKKFISNIKFNTRSHLINIKYYKIKMPYLFFLLYTVYSIHHRRARYNLYIRGDLFFQEHFSKMHYFIWHNLGYGRLSPTRYVSLFVGQKLHTYYMLSSHIEFKWFNKWFMFYYAHNTRLLKASNVKNEVIKPLYQLLSKETSIIHLTNNKSFKKLGNWMINVYGSTFFKSRYLYELFNAYHLFMLKKVTKFDKNFVFAHFSFLEYEPMVQIVYLVPLDKQLFINYLNKKLMLMNYLNTLKHINYINFYFLNDLFNIKVNNGNILMYTLKSLHFFDKIFKIYFILLDPFFFKYFYEKCFPRLVHLLVKCADYIVYNMLSFVFDIQNIDKLRIEFDMYKYNYVMYYLYWKIDTSNTFVYNFAHSNSILQTNIAINSIYLQRFKDLAGQINNLMKNAKFKTKKFKQYSYYYIMDILKNHYLELLWYNTEYIFLFFFLNIKKYSKLLLNTKINPYSKFIYSNFIYRYYIYNIWLESRYYDDWFRNPKKRIYWIYKNFLKHEGKHFYTKKGDII